MMLFQLIANHPTAIGNILKGTPVWVWGLATGLLALGLSQLRRRQASLTRVVVMPIAMTIFGLWGLASAFGPTPLLAEVAVVWLLAAVAMAAIVSRGDAGATYDPPSRTFDLPGSWVPLALIGGIFLTKYAVGIELALQPSHATEANFALSLAVLYGLFNGVFAGRTARLLRIARQPAARFA